LAFNDDSIEFTKGDPALLSIILAVVQADQQAPIEDPAGVGEIDPCLAMFSRFFASSHS
jgi:hypothetical protein